MAFHFPDAGDGYAVIFSDDPAFLFSVLGHNRDIIFHDPNPLGPYFSNDALLYADARFTRDGQTMTLKVDRENDELFDGAYKKLVFHRISEDEFMAQTKDVVWPEEFSEIRAEIHAGALELEAAESACESASESLSQTPTPTK